MSLHFRRLRARRVAAFVSTSLVLAGCAASSQDIVTTYVSPLQYQPYDCTQLQLELQRIQGRVVELGGRLDQAAANDKALAGVGIVLFWPALFSLGGTKWQEAEYGRLRGEYEAVQQTMIQKKCGAPASPTFAAPAPAASAAAQ